VGLPSGKRVKGEDGRAVEVLRDQFLTLLTTSQGKWIKNPASLLSETELPENINFYDDHYILWPSERPIKKGNSTNQTIPTILFGYER